MVLATNEEEIKRELYYGGPMLMGLQIWEDFLNYESGVYKQTVGE